MTSCSRSRRMSAGTSRRRQTGGLDMPRRLSLSCMAGADGVRQDILADRCVWHGPAEVYP